MIPRELRASGIVPAAGPLALDLGTPAAGQVWDLRRLAIVDELAPQTVRAAITIVATPQGGVPSGAALDPGDVADTSAAGLPFSFSWSRGTIMLAPGEHAAVWLYNLAAAVAVVAVAQAEESRA